MNNPILMVDPTGMAADTTGGNLQPIITPKQAAGVTAGVVAVNVLKEVVVTGYRYMGNALSSFGSAAATGTLGSTVTGTVGLVLLPFDAGNGSERYRPFVILPIFLPKEKEKEGIRLTSEKKTADELLPGSLKRSPSYNSKYGNNACSKLEELARKGDLVAKKMKKLVDQVPRLLEKNK